MSNLAFKVIMNEPEVRIERAEGKKCERCWKIKLEVGFAEEIDDVCLRCYKVLNTTNNIDEHELYARRFDHLYRIFRGRGLDKAHAVIEAGKLNRYE